MSILVKPQAVKNKPTKTIMNHFKLTLTLLLTLFFMTTINAQDWANLGRYQEQNAELLKERFPGDRVVFMGNSITDAWIKWHPAFFKDKPYVDRGISGQTTPQMLLRFRQDVIDLKPSVVVILAGINDIAGNTGPMTIDQTFGNIVSMAELAEANKIAVVLCSVLPAFDFPWNPGQYPSSKIIKLNKALEKYAKKNRIVYVDYYSKMVNDALALKEELGNDGVHPNSEGYDVMEPMVEKGIRKALNRRND